MFTPSTLNLTNQKNLDNNRNKFDKLNIYYKNLNR